METGDHQAMKLFEVLPNNFFRLLTGSNKELYAEAGLLIYEQSQRDRFGIRYDVMRDLLQELIETQQELGLAYAPDDDELLDDEVRAPGGNTRTANRGSGFLRIGETGAQQITVEEAARMQANAMLRGSKL